MGDDDNSKNDIQMENVMTGANTSSSTNSAALFPLARIKKIMKADKDVNLVSADAVNLVSTATELFLDAFVRKASEISQNEKRRTILYKDFGTILVLFQSFIIIFFIVLASAVKQDVRYSFLQGMCIILINYYVLLYRIGSGNCKCSGSFGGSTPTRHGSVFHSIAQSSLGS